MFHLPRILEVLLILGQPIPHIRYSQIQTIFNENPIGEKYREKGVNKDNWLLGEYRRAKSKLKMNIRIRYGLKNKNDADQYMFPESLFLIPHCHPPVTHSIYSCTVLIFTAFQRNW